MGGTIAGDNVRQTAPFLSVSDMAASVRHYVDGLGFRIVDRWEVDGRIRWCWLQRGGGALMLQEFPARGHDAWIPAGKVGEGVCIYFICEDALAIHRELGARGIATDPPFVGNGCWVVPLTDPDGYRLCFESPTDAAEETRLSN